MKVTLEMSQDDLKILRSILAVSKLPSAYKHITDSAANQLDKQLYPGAVRGTFVK